MAEHPKVFISYSHDSPEHKQWVSELGAKLRHKGVDVILDQWDIGLGGDLTIFIEQGITESDRVLVICTDSYVSKANAGKDGVGYERMIVTAELFENLGTDKFIPVIRQASGKEKTPTFLGTRVYADFRNESQYDEEFTKLLHELHRVSIVEKPPLGKNPFAQSSSGQEAQPSEELNTQLPDILEQVESASDAYSAAVEIARAGDVVGWRQLIKRIKPSTLRSLVEWKNESDGQLPERKEEATRVVDKAVDIISSLISVALAGVESDREQFRDQKSTLHDLLNIPGWSSEGYAAWVDIPQALGYVYHSLHGSLSLNTDQLDFSLSLAQVKIPVLGRTEQPYLWEIDTLMGWSKSFGPNCRESWEYLAAAYKRWEWLSPIFGDELEYRTSLVAYYMALHIHELAVVIASDQQDTLISSRYCLKVPLNFVSEIADINERAIALLRRNPESLMELWTSLNVTRQQMKDLWRYWIRSSGRWLAKIYGPSYTRVYHEHLFEVL